MAERIRTVEKDPAGGWIARDPATGEEITEPGWRWNCRESARDAVWQAKHLTPQRTAGVKTCDCERAMVPAGETCNRCGGIGTAGVQATFKPNKENDDGR